VKGSAHRTRRTRRPKSRLVRRSTSPLFSTLSPHDSPPGVIRASGLIGANLCPNRAGVPWPTVELRQQHANADGSRLLARLQVTCHIVTGHPNTLQNDENVRQLRQRECTANTKASGLGNKTLDIVNALRSVVAARRQTTPMPTSRESHRSGVPFDIPGGRQDLRAPLTRSGPIGTLPVFSPATSKAVRPLQANVFAQQGKG
jgi:hypothetical protein